MQRDTRSAVQTALVEGDQTAVSITAPTATDIAFLDLSRAVDATLETSAAESPVDEPVASPLRFFRHFVWPNHRIRSDGQLEEVGPDGNMAAGHADQPTSGSSPTTTDVDAPMVPILMVGVRGTDGINTHTASNSDAPSGRSWIIWIAAGVYPPSHPLIAVPSLLSGFDNAASYEQLLALAQILGVHKPPTATAADIDASDLPIVKGGAVGALADDDEIHENTSTSCLVCLDEYADDDDVRILGCKHAFHACVLVPSRLALSVL